MKVIRSARRRGAIMLFVLVAIAIVGILVAAYYGQASDTVLTAQAVAAQQVALSRAEKGFQDAVRSLRSGMIPVVGISQCTAADPKNCPVGSFYYSSPVDNGSTKDLSEGGGLEFDYYIYKRDIVPRNRFIVRSTGYFGYRLSSANLVTSIVEAEVDVGESNRFRCTDDYECR